MWECRRKIKNRDKERADGGRQKREEERQRVRAGERKKETLIERHRSRGLKGFKGSSDYSRGEYTYRRSPRPDDGQPWLARCTLRERGSHGEEAVQGFKDTKETNSSILSSCRSPRTPIRAYLRSDRGRAVFLIQ